MNTESDTPAEPPAGHAGDDPSPEGDRRPERARTSAAGDEGGARHGDERARILQMVADGKITVDEAVELLNAIGAGERTDNDEVRDIYGPPGGFGGHGPWP